MIASTKKRVSKSRLTNTKNRRSRSQILELRRKLHAIVAAQRPMTVRQVAYQASVNGLIAKNENEFKNTVGRLLVKMRKDGQLPFSWITDNTRYMRKPNTWTGLDSLLDSTAQLYRRDLWESQDCYVEIWCEKDALSGVLYPVTREFDVPLMITRGYPSLTYIHSAAEQIAAEGKPAFIYYFGDYDPSGLDIAVKVETGLRKYAPQADITFERVAVTQEQIERWNLPSRPTKSTDSRAKSFKGRSVELDAITPEDLRQLVRNCIEQHIDADTLARTKRVEELERDTLRTIAYRMRLGDFDDSEGSTS